LFYTKYNHTRFVHIQNRKIFANISFNTNSKHYPCLGSAPRWIRHIPNRKWRHKHKPRYARAQLLDKNSRKLFTV